MSLAKSRKLLELTEDAEALRSELVPFIGAEDSARRGALMGLPGQRSLGSVLEDFIEHRDRKCTFGTDGRAIRRHVLVRRRNQVGLGKEANRIEDARVLGQRVAGGRAKTYVDPDPFKGSATEVARRLGVSRRTVFNRRRRIAISSAGGQEVAQGASQGK